MATKCFPSLVKMVRGAESDFSTARLRMVREEWQTEFFYLVESNWCQAIILDAEDEDDCKGFNEWNLVLCEVEDILFRKWAVYNYLSSLPLVEFPPKERDVHKQSRAILCYTAGWILSCAGKANKAGKGLMIEFSMRHLLKASEAIAEGLPTSVVDRREKKTLPRSSKAFFQFLCQVECVYISNLTIGMMVAYTAGDLLGAIHSAIMNDEGVQTQFHLLLLGLKFEDTDVSIFLEYVLRKYKRMRGRWFVKAVRSQTADGANAVSKMTTRDGVVAADKAAKAAGAAVRKI
jgi:hypothetical protein